MRKNPLKPAQSGIILKNPSGQAVWIRFLPDGVKDNERDTVSLEQVRLKGYRDGIDYDGCRFQFPLQDRAGRRKTILGSMQAGGLSSSPPGSPAQSE